MFQRGLTPPDPFGERGILETARTQDSMTLKAMAELGPVLVVLLPEPDRANAWLKAVQEARPGLEAQGIRLVLVHMTTQAAARALFEPFDLHYLARIADPERALYRHFELGRARRLLGPLRQMPGLIWLKGEDVVDAERPEWDQKVPMRLIGPSGPN